MHDKKIPVNAEILHALSRSMNHMLVKLDAIFPRGGDVTETGVFIRIIVVATKKKDGLRIICLFVLNIEYCSDVPFNVTPFD